MKVAQGETLGTLPSANPPPRRGGMKQGHLASFIVLVIGTDTA